MNPVAVFLLAALMLVFAAINGLLIRRLRRRRTVLWALLVLGIVIPLACSLYFEKENPGGIPRRYIQVAR